MSQGDSSTCVFTSTSPIRFLATTAVGRRQIRISNAGKQKPFLHVGDSVLWCPMRKLRRLLSPLYSTIKTALRGFVSSNGYYCAFLFATEILICDLQLGDRSLTLGSFKVALPSLNQQEVLKIFVSDDGVELAILTSKNSLYVFSIHTNTWESISSPVKQGKYGLHIHWTPENMSVYHVSATNEEENILYISLLSRTRGSFDNITKVCNWKTFISFGFFLMDSVDYFDEGNMDIMVDYNSNSNTLAIIASWRNSCILAMVYMSCIPGGYLLPILQIMHRRTHVSSASSEGSDNEVACMTWLFSATMPILALMLRSGKLICVTPAGRIWFPKDMPMISPLERINKVLPILDPAFSISTGTIRGEYCITSGMDLDDRLWLLATDGHILSSTIIEPSFDLFTSPKHALFTPYQVSEWHDYLLFGLATDTLSEVLLASLPESLNVLLEWIDSIFLPCQSTNLMLGLEFFQNLLYRLFCFIPSRDFLAIHVIRHIEKWLGMIFGEQFVWKDGWKPIISCLSQQTRKLSTSEEALYETALMLGPSSPDPLVPFEDLEPICQYIQGGDVIGQFQSKYHQFLVFLHQDLRFAYEIVLSTNSDISDTPEWAQAIRMTWIDFGVQVIYSKEYQWTMPVYVPSVLEDSQKVEVDILFLQESYSNFNDIFSPEVFFSVAARNKEHTLNLLASSKNWSFCWTTRLLLAFTLQCSAETEAVIDVILREKIEENNVKDLLFVGKVIQSADIVLPLCYTELILGKLVQLIRLHFSLIPPINKGDYPSIQFLITQSILESNFSESSIFVLILDWVQCCLYFSQNQPLFFTLTRILYALHLRISLIENDSQSTTYLESALALLHFDDLFSVPDLLELAKCSLQRYPLSQWLDILQATSYDLSPTILSGVLDTLNYETIQLAYSTDLLNDPRFLAFHHDLHRVVSETLFVTCKGTSLYDIMQMHWQPELPPLLAKNAWSCLLQSIEPNASVFQTNEVGSDVPEQVETSSPPKKHEEALCSLDMNVASEENTQKFPENLEAEESKPIPLNKDPLMNLDFEECLVIPKPASVSCSMSSVTSSDQCDKMMSSLKSTLEQLQTDLKNLVLPDVRIKKKISNRPKTTPGTKKKSIVRTSTLPSTVSRSPSFEKFLNERVWKKKETELLGIQKTNVRKHSPHSEQKEIVRLVLLHGKT